MTMRGFLVNGGNEILAFQTDPGAMVAARFRSDSQRLKAAARGSSFDDPQPEAPTTHSNLLPAEIEGFDFLAELTLDMHWAWNHATRRRVATTASALLASV
jgi:hypothetical protein